MAFVNMKNKQIQVKLVYYGPGRGGKTTNLESIFKIFKDRVKSELVTVKTSEDRTLFFDFIPFNMGTIGGYDVIIQIYTVPGQIKYDSTRKLVLKGVDGVVFVADSLAASRDKNRRSLKNLAVNLAAHKKSIFDIPLVLQYNKRDLGERGIPILPLKVLEQDLNAKLKVPIFAASALVGTNVVQTLKKITLLIMHSIENQL